MEETKELTIISDAEGMTVVFSDLVQVESNKESIYLNFLQKAMDDSDGMSANLMARIAVTWPHFARITAMFNDILENEREQLKDHLNKTLFKNTSTL